MNSDPSRPPRPRAGVGIEAEQNPDGTFDTRRDGRAWRYDQDWDEVVRAARAEGHPMVQVVDLTGYREWQRV